MASLGFFKIASGRECDAVLSNKLKNEEVSPECRLKMIKSSSKLEIIDQNHSKPIIMLLDVTASRRSYRLLCSSPESFRTVFLALHTHNECPATLGFNSKQSEKNEENEEMMKKIAQILKWNAPDGDYH